MRRGLMTTAEAAVPVCILMSVERAVSVDGREWRFDWHEYMGPAVLGKRGNVLSRQPGKVLAAISLWSRQGHRIERGECVWDHEPEPVVEHIAGRQHRVVGYRPAVRGR